MNKQFFSRVLLVVICIATLTSCNKDDDGNSSVKLLETVIYNGKLYLKFEYDNQNRITKIISYGEALDVTTGEIIECIDEYLLKYNASGDLISANPEFGYCGTITYLKNENKVIVDMQPYSNQSETYYLNNEGYPSKYELATWHDDCTNYGTKNFVYQNNNLIQVSWDVAQNCNPYSSGTREYTFDDKKSPFYYCKTPKWYIIHFTLYFDESLLSMNNVKTATHFFEYEPETGFKPMTVTTTCVLEYDNDGFLRSRSGTTYNNDAYSYLFTYKTGY